MKSYRILYEGVEIGVLDTDRERNKNFEKIQQEHHSSSREINQGAIQ